MYSIKTIVLTVCLVLYFAAVVSANSLENRHQLGLEVGLWNRVNEARNEVGIGVVSSSAGTTGLLGGVTYGYWFTERFSLNIDLGMMRASVESKVGVVQGTTTATSVTHVLVTAKRYFSNSTPISPVRPYMSAGIGPFVRSQSKILLGRIIAEEATTETVLGGQIGAGIDFITGRHFMTGISLSYNLMSDFDRPIGGSSNYSGPEFTLGFSYLFGHGRGF